MPHLLPATFTCPRCGATTSWGKPGIAAFVGVDLLATVVALPFFAFGVIGFVIAVCVAGFALMAFVHRNTRCRGCGKRISRAQAVSLSGKGT